MARIKLLDKEQADPVARDLFQKLEDNGACIFNAFRVIAHSPHILPSFMSMGKILFEKVELSAKLRELAILRVATLSESEYEWVQHIAVAPQAGVTEEQISAVPTWEKSSCFSDKERSVLRYIDEVAQDIKVKDKTFNTLRNYLSEREILELTFVVGFWGMLARVLVALEVDLDTDANLTDDLKGGQLKGWS